MSQAADFLAIAHRLADAARAVILPHYRSGLAIDDKADASPVTLADRAAEQAMRAILAAELPEHGIVGEEFGNHGEDAEWVWVLDPIDGTKSFIVGRPSFCTLIGLLHHGIPVLGLIDQAVLAERWIGVLGQASTFNGQPLRTSTATSLAAARLGSTGPQYLPGQAGERFQALAAACRFTVWGGDAYQYALLASGGYELVVESGLKLHDFAALVPVVLGAGGMMTDWQGRALDRDSAGQVLVAATPELHAAAMAYL
ncbi:histidinol phosphate phosphatase [Chitinimonas arctica]|uniref:Histidinol phosphate phosphatase n=1 Tax=Chitinimonas arctica TaxID=2594795 RepID=A0A516SIY2_9NEIS|nr:inositol monophosphatase family protein [Chitinimonas arctica]QDQ28101.1 histidinol phosphate phosphatase [Chitinimonas arctica]